MRALLMATICCLFIMGGRHADGALSAEDAASTQVRIVQTLFPEQVIRLDEEREHLLIGTGHKALYPTHGVQAIDSVTTGGTVMFVAVRVDAVDPEQAMENRLILAMIGESPAGPQVFWREDIPETDGHDREGYYYFVRQLRPVGEVLSYPVAALEYSYSDAIAPPRRYHTITRMFLLKPADDPVEIWSARTWYACSEDGPAVTEKRLYYDLIDSGAGAGPQIHVRTVTVEGHVFTWNGERFEQPSSRDNPDHPAGNPPQQEEQSHE